MTLQPENGAPSFYTFATFRLGRTAFMYGCLLSLLAFCAVAFVFNYGIRETLWSVPERLHYGSIAPSEIQNTPSSVAASSENIVRVALPDRILHSLTGAYFSPEANRKYVVSLQQGQLILRIDSQPLLELVPVSDDTLYAGEGHLLKFHPTAMGTVDRLDFYDNGRHIVALRQY
jgi:hypothetical protein